MKLPPLIALLTLLGWATLPVSAQTLTEKITTALEFSKLQLDDLAQRSGSSRFVSYTDTSGIWQNQSISNWCSGFPAGLMWMMYDYTGENVWATYGRDWTNAVSARATASDNDTGFQIYCAYGYGLRHASDTLSPAEISVYTAKLNQAADSFANQRYHPTIESYRAWTNRRTSISTAVSSPSITASTNTPYNNPYFEVNIDMMMNMELPVYVGLNGGNSDYDDFAINHADATFLNQVRPDGSTFHVVAYDESANVLYKRTHQGADTDTTWSRGQAWAVYGYTMMYRYTNESRMLDRAVACFDYFMAAVANQSDDFVAYSDFDRAVGGSTNHPRDTSASAIVASAAIELYEFTQDEKFLTAAENILGDLTSPPYLASASPGFESILTKGSEKYDNKAEEGTIFGDFYFVEAMLRYLALDTEPVDDGFWGGHPVVDGWVDTGDYLGWLNVEFAAFGFLYSETLGTWIYLLEETYTASQTDTGGWTYLYK
ncbi:hypothetical protein G0Q06_04205 [Puniceicoccales bacterium CK1056]|uniref:Uncharacterized protein n=1 Tax=Oceanipulchritudo coccoides TaxID=2706888 RepID=A0A6B2LZZ0_9BACT|nr:glycoside hydrolase family 76 protein [Oceanipulchritudo coccoides]NDV61646.1 hypothetical protein [Oceanipulchritudo coccoides]